jgi:lysyl-tRNA synthetase class 1
MYVTLYGTSDYVFSLNRKTYNGRLLHDNSTIIHNTNLHAIGVERGVLPYGGYGLGASSIGYHGKTIGKPTLPQRDIYEYLIKNKKMDDDIGVGVPNKKTKKKYNNPKNNGGIFGIVPCGNRFDDKKFIPDGSHVHWADIVADEIIGKFPDKDVYTCAAGISPSGVVHFGNLRDVMITHAVAKALENKGKKTRIIFSWDDLDRFRKVPVGLPPFMAEHIGKPLSMIPDLLGVYGSYAARYEKKFEETIDMLGIPLEYKYQTQEYLSGKYAEYIDIAIKQRKKIAATLFGFMSEIGKKEKGVVENKFIDSYYPISIYSRFTGKDATRIINYENYHLTYECLETGDTETIDIRNGHQIKLSWKVDWPMRWKHENIVFEPGGHDHASPGGSYDVSSVIAREIYGIEPPVFVGYQFIGIQGLDGKMSGSSGNAIAPGELLKIYEPEMLKWLYMRRSPNQSFQLSFGTEIIRQYDEFDKEINEFREGKLVNEGKRSLELSFAAKNSFFNVTNYKPTSFKQIASFGQIVDWDKEKLAFIFGKNEISFDSTLLKVRMDKARAWLTIYNSEEQIVLLEEKNLNYYQTLDGDNIAWVARLVNYLKGKGSFDIAELEKELYSIPKLDVLEQKENALRQRAFFKNIYNLLIGKDAGPRLATFIWATPVAKILLLLDFKNQK